MTAFRQAFRYLTLWPMVISLLALWPQLARAEFRVPELTGPVVDGPGVIDANSRRQLENLLYQVRANGGSQITVLIVDSLDGSPIESASIAVTDKWQLGKKREDRGVLLMVAQKEKKIRIEVGRGLEGVLTDVRSQHIINDAIVPRIQNGDWGGGLRLGVLEILKLTDPNLDATLGLSRRQAHRPEGGRHHGLIFILGLIFLLFLLRGGRMNRSDFFTAVLWGLLGGGGGGYGGGRGDSDRGDRWSGGGGGFGGGGASGGWS